MMKKILLYTLYIGVVTAAFAYFLFPSDAVKDYIVRQVKAAEPNLELQIEKIRPALPPGLALGGTRLFYETIPLVESPQVRVLPVMTTLFSSETAIGFKGLLYGGNFKGVALFDRPPEAKPQLKRIEAGLSGVQVAQVHALEKLPQDYEVLSGLLSGTIDLRMTDAGETGEATLSIADLGLKIDVPMIDLGPINFNEVKAGIDMVSDRRIQIRECTFKGPQVNGTLSGDLEIMDLPEQSRLNLTGTITPHAAFLANLSKGFPASLLFKKRSGKSELAFAIRGTLKNPQFSLL